jgi:hypothetical protein
MSGHIYSACGSAFAAVNKPFPQHTTYTSERSNRIVLKCDGQRRQDQMGRMKAAYLKPAVTDIMSNITRTGKQYPAHGYGMLFTVLMAGYDSNAQTYYNGSITITLRIHAINPLFNVLETNSSPEHQ